VALARALLDPADLLILDEPTNHIDADAIAWLEEYLRDVPALLMVTHDRYFLDRVCNRIVELDRRELVSYPGNYQAYLQRREERQERLAAQEEKRRILIKQELEWLRRGVQARGTKQKFRKQRVGELLQISQDKGENQLAWMLATGRRLGKSVLRVQGLSKAFGERTLFDDIDFELEPGDRLGIIGPNGSGKTTFLDVLAGLEPADSGRIDWGETVHLGYYDQHGDDLKDDMKVIDFIEQDAALIRTKNGERVDAAQMLDWFLFPRPQQHAKVGSLSGGERRRLYLLHMLVHQPNVIFLDEPTNDLDIEILQVLESFLDNFQGSLIVVSHDRYFLDRTVDYLFNIEEGHLGTRYPGPYENYQRIHEELAAAEAALEKPIKVSIQASKASDKKPADSATTRKLSWKEQRELEQLEQEIAQWEAEKKRIASALNAAGSDYERVMALSAELATINDQLESAEWRWLELTEHQ
jgi:ATP-binding cassette subfamily F protein uup